MRTMGPTTWLRSEPSLKIASVVLALFVWMYVRSEDKPIQALSVPLELEGLPEDLAVAGRTLENLTVRVRAPEAVLSELTPSRFKATARLDDAQPGEHAIELTPALVHAPLGVEVLSVDPTTLTLKVERLLSRELPVVPRFRGGPAPPWEAGGYTVAPSKVTVQGPERIVRPMTQVTTDEVDLTGRTESFEAVVALRPGYAGVRLKDKGAAASVQVTLREPPASRSFDKVQVVPKTPGRSAHAVRVQPESVSVVLEGPIAILSQIREDGVEAVLDLEGMGPRAAPYAVPPRVVIQPASVARDIKVRSISHQAVMVTISRGAPR